jgi:Tfp pilus assembly protein PilF
VTKGGPTLLATEPIAAPPETTASTPAPAAAADAQASATDVTGSVFVPAPAAVVRPFPPFPPGGAPPGPWSATEDATDKLALGKRQFREGNYGLAEKNFRLVVEEENVPAQRKAEAWVGLAASYDRLKRFDLADRAYHAAVGILGATPEILNNHGFSYILRGDYRRARLKLTEAIEKDPTNPYIRNNIELLERSMRGGGGRKKI